MFSSPVLDLVILLSFTYFIGSLILSAINEAIAGTFRLRQDNLKTGIYNFFLSPPWRQFIEHVFLKSPHIQTLMQSPGKLPVYIPARNFVLAIIENIDGAFYKKGIIQSLPKIINGMVTEKTILPNDIITVLETIMKQVSNLSPDKMLIEFENKLEEFYNLTMDRVTGWYKRRIRGLLLILGIVLSVALNIDTIKITNDAMRDKARLSKAVDNISANIKNLDTLRNSYIKIKDSANNITISNLQASVEKPIVTYEETTGYELGYTDFDEFKKQWAGHFWKKLLGILLTAFALQLGSNYWFDLMNKAVNVRAAGRKPDQERETKK